jgi:aminoglycoside phosphotransferase (APT) family kinase protein
VTPRRFEEITPAWLTSLLRESGTLGDARVTDVAVEPIGLGVGFLGQLARLRLGYERPAPALPRTIIGKLPTLDPGGRQVCQLFKFYEREIRFYRELAGRIPVRVPRCYASVMDVDADAFMILLEDLAAVPMGDDAAGCSAAQAETAVRTIAELHGAWWASAALDGLDWMPLANAPVHQFAEPLYQQSLEPFLASFGDHLSPKMRGITERLAKHVIDMLDLSAQPPITLAHGDFRLDNIFFDGARVAAIDWQIAFRGTGAFDLAYFLGGCLDPAVRHAEEMRLVRLWHELATGGRAGFTFDDALLAYRRAVLYCHVYTVIATGSLNPSNERGMAVFRAWLHRRSAAIEDLDAGELMPA